MTRLHVNIDHIATLRQARGVNYPDPVFGVSIAEMAGASGITAHLREDRRHMTDRDIRLLKETVSTVFNLEMATTDEIIQIAVNIKPDMCTLVPERREERTTEGGLIVADDFEKIKNSIETLNEAGIKVSLFIDPVEKEIEASKRAGAQMIELHTGDYSLVKRDDMPAELEKLASAARLAKNEGLEVAAGHGLHYHNVNSVSMIPEIVELNIGHSIIARSVFTGLDQAVVQMIEAMK